MCQQQNFSSIKMNLVPIQLVPINLTLPHHHLKSRTHSTRPQTCLWQPLNWWKWDFIPKPILFELDQMMMRRFELKVYPIPSHPSIIELDQMMMRMFESGQSAIAGSQVLQQAGHCVLCKHRQWWRRLSWRWWGWKVYNTKTEMMILETLMKSYKSSILLHFTIHNQPVFIQ